MRSGLLVSYLRAGSFDNRRKISQQAGGGGLELRLDITRWSDTAGGLMVRKEGKAKGLERGGREGKD